MSAVELIRDLRGGKDGHVNPLRMTDVAEITRLQMLCLMAADEIESMIGASGEKDHKSD